MEVMWLTLLLSVSTVLAGTSEIKGIWTEHGCMVPVEAENRNARYFKGLLDYEAEDRSVVGVVRGSGCNTPCGCYQGDVVKIPPVNYGPYFNNPLVSSPYTPINTGSSASLPVGLGVSEYGINTLPLPIHTGTVAVGSSTSASTHALSQQDSSSAQTNNAAISGNIGLIPAGVTGQVTGIQSEHTQQSQHNLQASDSQYNHDEFGAVSGINAVRNPVIPMGVVGQGPVYSTGLSSTGIPIANGGVPIVGSSTAYVQDSIAASQHSLGTSDSNVEQSNYAGYNYNGGLNPIVVRPSLPVSLDSSFNSQTSLEAQESKISEQAYNAGFSAGYTAGVKTDVESHVSASASSHVSESSHSKQESSSQFNKQTQGVGYVGVGNIAPVSLEGSAPVSAPVAVAVNLAPVALGTGIVPVTNTVVGISGSSEASKQHSLAENDSKYTNVKGGAVVVGGTLGGGLVANVGEQESLSTHSKNENSASYTKDKFAGIKVSSPVSLVGLTPVGSVVGVMGSETNLQTASKIENESNYDKKTTGVVSATRPVGIGLGISNAGAAYTTSESMGSHNVDEKDLKYNSNKFAGYNQQGIAVDVLGRPLVGSVSGVVGEQTNFQTHSKKENENTYSKNTAGIVNTNGVVGVGARPVNVLGNVGVGYTSESGSSHNLNEQDMKYNSNKFAGYNQQGIAVDVLGRPLAGSVSGVVGEQTNLQTHSKKENENTYNKNTAGIVNTNGVVGLGQRPVNVLGNVGVGYTSESGSSHNLNEQDMKYNSNKFAGYNQQGVPVDYLGRPISLGSSSVSGIVGEQTNLQTHSKQENENKYNKNTAGIVSTNVNGLPILPVGVAGSLVGSQTLLEAQESQISEQAFNAGYNAGYSAGVTSDEQTHGSLLAASQVQTQGAGYVGVGNGYGTSVNLDGSASAVAPVSVPVAAIGLGVGSNGAAYQTSESASSHNLDEKDMKYSSNKFAGYNQEGIAVDVYGLPVVDLVSKGVVGEQTDFATHSKKENQNTYSKNSAGVITSNINGPLGIGYRPIVGSPGHIGTAYTTSESVGSHNVDEKDLKYNSNKFAGYNQQGIAVDVFGRPLVGSVSGIAGEQTNIQTHSKKENENTYSKNTAGIVNTNGVVGVGARPVNVLGNVGVGFTQSESGSSHNLNEQDMKYNSNKFAGYNQQGVAVDVLGRPLLGSVSGIAGEQTNVQSHSKNENANAYSKNTAGIVNTNGVVGLGGPVNVLGNVGVGYTSESGSSHNLNEQDMKYNSNKFVGYNQQGVPVDYLGRPISLGSSSVSGIVGEQTNLQTHSKQENDNKYSKNTAGVVNVNGPVGFGRVPIGGVGNIGSSYVTGETGSSHNLNEQDMKYNSNKFVGVNQQGIPIGVAPVLNPSGVIVPSNADCQRCAEYKAQYLRI